MKIIIAIGLVLGGVQFCFNSDSRMGMKFREGFAMTGQMILSVAGIMTITPVFATLLKPAIVPVANFIGADPSCFSFFLGCDMGGYPMAVSLAESKSVADMIGLAPAAMIGGTLTFAVPVAKAVLTVEEFHLFSKGMLMGIVTIPVGTIAGGFIQGMPMKEIVINSIPILIISIMLSIGFYICPDQLVRMAEVLGNAIAKIGLVGLIAGGVTYLTGFTVIPGMPPVMDGMVTVCGMIFILAGTLPLLDWINRKISTPLDRIGNRMGLNAASFSGLLFTFASSVPTFSMMKDMTKRGIIINSAWIVTCVGLLGSQIGFVLQEAPKMLVPFVSAKLIAGVICMTNAFIFTRNIKGEKEVQKENKM
ncbi:ethanolamine utilization protein EutH [Faecalicatena orotica]|uniref:ethanolamine utilization protein EutH n=1 Tax=Faecalicatena orotica TaxID=1544 RepID=UPI00321703FF